MFVVSIWNCWRIADLLVVVRVKANLYQQDLLPEIVLLADAEYNLFVQLFANIKHDDALP